MNYAYCETPYGRSLLDLASQLWTRSFQYGMPSATPCIRVIKGRLFCCQENQITVYNQAMQPMLIIPCLGMGQIFDVADTPFNDYIVATEKKGLVRINYRGKTNVTFGS